jgi:hypothetical protein
MSTPHPPVLTAWIVADLTATLGVIATILLFVGAVGLGIAVFMWVRKWRQGLAGEPTIEAQIESYRHMLDEGLIDDQEYDHIVAQLQSPPGPEPPAPPQNAPEGSTGASPPNPPSEPTP